MRLCLRDGAKRGANQGRVSTGPRARSSKGVAASTPAPYNRVMHVDGARPLAEGELLGGRYRIEVPLAQGGMGAVFVATDLELRTRVAVKVLLPQVADQLVSRARFEREARAAARLTSPHAVRVLDVGTGESGALFVVMELLVGEDLENRCQRVGPLFARDVAGMMLQACDALAEAHALGIVHRDVKPRNLFAVHGVNGQTFLKVLDFGISKWTESQEHTVVTRSSEVLGTPHYMSPEQLMSPRDVDARADVWGLGATMYRLLGGRRPFDAATIPHVCSLVLSASPKPLSSIRLDLPPAFVAVVERCLEKEPSARFPSVLELARALRPFVSLEPTLLLAPEPEASSDSAPRVAQGEPGRGGATASASLPRPAARMSAPPRLTAPQPGSELALASGPRGRAVEATAVLASPPILRRNRPRWPAVVGLGLVGLLAAVAVVVPREWSQGQSGPSSDAPAEPQPAGPDDPTESLPVRPADHASSVTTAPTATPRPDASSATLVAKPRRPSRAKVFRTPAGAPVAASASPSLGPPDVRH
jgi:eukaryotic-like serine/threonine-protein kinase